MPPQSRGGSSNPPPTNLAGFQSKSTPNLPTLRSLRASEHSTSRMPPPNRRPDTSNSSARETPHSLYKPANTIDGYTHDARRNKARLLSPSASEDEDGGNDDDDSGGEEEDGLVGNLPAPGRPISQHLHSRSHTYLGPSAFAPPFYNRPPTPLPPSPSLTSLLRPTFSSQNSRPTTPDPSSDEAGTPQIRASDVTGTQTPNSAAASTLTSTLRSAKPIPRASPRVPTYEYYGFTLYLTSSLAFIVYLLWAFLPSPFLHQLGIYYYPNRWWALAIPAWTVMLIVYIYVALASYSVGYLTLPLKSVECLVDEASNIAVVDAQGKLIRSDRPSWRSPSPDRGGVGGKSGMGGSGVGGNSVGGIGYAKKGGHQQYAGVTKGKHSRQNSGSKTPNAAPELDWRRMWNEGTDAVMDIPTGGVCEILYGRGSLHEQDEEDDVEVAF